jgi:DNA polymerase-3 subunit epsilon
VGLIALAVWHRGAHHVCVGARYTPGVLRKGMEIERVSEKAEMDASDLETVARQLEASGDYRVLRKMTSREGGAIPAGSATRLAIVLDVETTGLGSHDQIIALAMVPVIYGPAEGIIYKVLPAFERYQEPSNPIPAAITALTGIDDAMVAGHAISEAEVAAFVEPADLVIAHNAKFDRGVVERQWKDVFEHKPWACSQSQIPWALEGFEGTKLSYIANAYGFFYERHRAVHDCHATIEVLARRLPRSGMTALRLLLENARKSTSRIWANGAPFESKDLLRARGYRWSAGDDGRLRSWYLDVNEDELVSELAFLRREVLGTDSAVHTKITALHRFSSRA